MGLLLHIKRKCHETAKICPAKTNPYEYITIQRTVIQKTCPHCTLTRGQSARTNHCNCLTKFSFINFDSTDENVEDELR